MKRLFLVTSMAITLASVPASAMTLDVRLSGCDGVDQREVERLLGLELAFVASASSLRDALHVDLVCSGGTLRISAVDPVTTRPLERQVALGPPEAGRERTIALLASQLFVTSWAESFLEGSPDAAPLPSARPSASPRESHPEARRAAREWEMVGAVGVRLRDGSAPRVDQRIALRPSLGVGRARVILEVAYERGNARRAAGTVTWSMLSAGLGVGWRSGRFGPFAVEGLAAGSVVVAEAKGEDARPGIAVSSAHGVLGEASIAFGPVAHVGPVRFSLEPQLGVTFPGATARDSIDGAIALGGFWAGLTLAAGVAGATW